MNNKEKKTHSMKARGMISDVIVHVVLALLAIVWVIPVLWIALLSFSTQKGSYVTSFFPKGYTLHNYVRLFTDTQVLDFPQMFKNTFIIAVFSCLISTIFVLSVSYCMSRMRFKIRKTYMNIAMILGLFPAFMSMVAVYYILKAVGLSEGSMIRVALILVYSGGSGAGFLLAKGFFDTVPKALDEAAYLDGATRFQVFTKVTIPLSKPIIVYTTLSAFLGPWLDFIFAKVICRANAKYYTVALGLWKMLEKEYIDSWFLPVAQFPSHGPADRHSRCGGPSHGGLPERQKRQEIPPRNRVWFCPLGYGGRYRSLHGQELFPEHPYDADGADHNGEPSKAAEVCQK